MSCNLKVSKDDALQSSITEEITKVSKGNKLLATQYIVDLHRDDFAKKLKDKLEIDVNNIDEKDIPKVVELLREFHNEAHPDVNYSTQLNEKNDILKEYGYDSVSSREKAKQSAAFFMKDINRQIVQDKQSSIEEQLDKYNEKLAKAAKGKKVKKLTRENFFISAATSKVKKEIRDRLVNGNLATKEEVDAIFKESNTAKLEELFKKDASVENLNLLAMYKEILGNKEGFFKEVFRDPTLNQFHLDNKNVSEDTSYEALDEQLDEELESDESNNSQEDDKNNTIRELNEKLGDYNNFLTHVDFNIRNYFGSLPKLLTTEKVDGEYVLDKNNSLGLPEAMSAEQCISVLYSDGTFFNVNNMIASIRNIANNVPGMASFAKFADDLEKNRNFAFEVYRVFSKAIVNKLETTDADGEFKSRSSNRTADKLTTLKFEFYNSVKATSIIAESEQSTEMLNDLRERLTSLKNYKKNLDALKGVTKEDLDDFDKEVKSVIVDLHNILKRYYPTISDKALYNYVNSDNQINTLANLYNILNDTIKASKTSKEIYDSNRADIAKLLSEKSALEQTEYRGERVDYKHKKEINDKLKQLYSFDYVTVDSQKAAFQLAESLIKFSTVKTELNSRNVHGNQSSDVLNNNMIDNLMKTLANDTALENFGKYKGQTRQYDFSNIMIEHRDNNGKIINFGLFTQNPESKQLTPTPYAKRLLKSSLFSGAGSINTGNNVTYSESSKQDYSVTAFINFLKTEQDFGVQTDGYNIEFSEYFMRIPSDAPKNFTIRAPRYSSVGLFDKDGNVNVEHHIFKQFENIFIQELQDMATAINILFENDGGKVVCDNDLNSKTWGIPIFKGGYANDKETARKLYDNYHTKKGKILAKTEKGYKLLGNVFNSDRFKITVANKDGKQEVINFGERILQSGAFDILYGGANDTYIHTNTTGGGVEVYLTKDQKSVVEEQLKEFVKEVCRKSNSKFEQHKDFIPEGLLTTTNVRDFALNYRLMYTNFNDLFEGDTKFYKDSQTFLKRAKEAQASGVPYGIVDYTTDLSADPVEVESPLNTTEFVRKTTDGITEKVQIKQYDKFRGVTIKNTIRTGETIGTFKTNKDGKTVKWSKDENGKLVEDNNGNYIFDKKSDLAEKLIKVLVKTKMSEKGAEIQAANMLGAFADTTVNDAQSYITFEEWVRRITARGQLPKYKKLIDAILDETKPLDAKTLNAFIQVQKNFYYDQYYNKDLQTMCPRQIKNAEFVLVPRLIKGTQLEQVYNLMKEHNIDQLNTQETSKAGKCNVLTIWDDNGDITEENIKDFKANVTKATEYYSYNYLYTQQETPQHMNAENKAGIQIMKKIIDNIDSNSPIYHLKEKFFDLYSKNIEDSYNKLMKELDLKFDKDGNIVNFNKKEFYKMLQDEVARLGLDSNSIDYVTLDKNGEPIMPNYISNVSKKLESIAQSVFNNRITRQKLPGWHAAQITNVGWTPMNEHVEKRMYDDKLKYHPTTIDKDGNKVVQPYIEIKLPKLNFDGLEYKKKDGTLKTDEELLKEIQDAGLDMMIGYRIPTEGKQSVCVMKVVGFTDDALGSTIVVPDDWVAQTGSDFDIDSVYGINFTAKLNKETGKLEKYKYNDFAEASDDKTKGRNNEILQTMIEILSNDLSLEENLSRSNFDDIIHDRDEIISKKEANIRKERSPYDFHDQADYQEDVMSGAKLKGFSVARDSFTSICNTVKPVINSKYKIAITYRKEDGYDFKTLKKRFPNHEESKDGECLTIYHETFGWTNDNKNVVGKLLTAYSSQTTAHILDAVKEGAIPNVNDFTFKVYKIFPDVGSDYRTAISFIAQPGVSRIVEAYNNTKSVYKTSYDNPIDKAIENLLKDICGELKVKTDKRSTKEEMFSKVAPMYPKMYDLFNIDSNNFDIDSFANKVALSSSTMINRLNEQGDFKDNKLNCLLFDLGIVLKYKQLSELGDKISSMAMVCNPDKFGAKQTLFATNKTFDDIENIRTSSPFENDMLEEIYPGISGGFKNYINYNGNEKSKYPPLNNFLKYATATSILVNRHLFVTQDKGFIQQIYSLEKLFSNGKKISEQEYKDFENYVLNHLYNQAEAINSFVTYKDGNFVYNKSDDFIKESSRIYGYNKSSNLLVEDENGNFVEFSVENINYPTDLEIKQFASLSPAQKVFYVKQHFENSGLFEHIDVSLFNRGSNAGKQTIKYIENHIDNETAYNEFEKVFFNNNPIVALTAMDLIKYAFVVEGFKMRKNAINKIIPNSVLLSDKTNIIADIERHVRGLKNGINSVTSLKYGYIRSHSKTSKISSFKVDKNKNEVFELVPRTDFVITVTDTKLANKYGIIYNSSKNPNNVEYKTNSYVKLKFNNDYVLYRINKVADTYVLFPVNKLEENEYTPYSVNEDNNRFLQETYYTEVLNDFRKKLNEEQTLAVDNIEDPNFNINDVESVDIYSILKEHSNRKDELKYVSPKKVGRYVRNFNINKKDSVDSGGFEDVIKKVTDRFTETPFGVLYTRSTALNKYLSKVGDISTQTINGRQYDIQKISVSQLNRKYITKNGKSEVIKEHNEDINNIMRKAQKSGYTVHDVFKITPHREDSNVMQSSITEEESYDTMYSSVTEMNGVPTSDILGRRAMSSFYSRKLSEGDERAAKVLKFLQDKEINSSTESVHNNIQYVIQTTAEYIDGITKQLFDDMNYFIMDNNCKYHSIDSKEAMDEIKRNPVVREKFLRTILDAKYIVKNFSVINELDLDSEDRNLKPFLNKIKENVTKLQNSVLIDKVNKEFANEFLAKCSKNPLIQQDILSVLDGYHSVSLIEAWIGDLQETPSPLIQIITKDVIADIRKKDMLAKDEARNLRKQLEDIEKRAHEAGLDVNWSNIFNDYGKFVQDFNKALEDKILELRNNIRNAAIEYGAYSEKHIAAKQAYEEFKLKNINQPLVDDYYKEKLDIEKSITKGYQKIYQRYKVLSDKRSEILSHITNGVLADNYKEELKKIRKEINNLTDPNYYNQVTGEFIKKPQIGDPNNPFTGDEAEIYTQDAASVLKKYLSDIKKLDEYYFKSNVKFGFEEELNKNLDVILNYEKRDASGRPTVPAAELVKHEDYVKAKEWIENNTIYNVPSSVAEELSKAFSILKKSSKDDSIFKSIVKLRDAKDSYGVVDGRKLTSEDISKLYKEQLKIYNITDGEIFSDKTLISNAPSFDIKFTNEFYKSMTLDGAKNSAYLNKVNEINTILKSYYDDVSQTLQTAEMSEDELRHLRKLYKELDDIKKYEKGSNSNAKAVHEFIDENVDFIYDEDKFQQQEDAAKLKGNNYHRIWLSLNTQIIQDENGNDKVVPNRYIYGVAVPKGFNLNTNHTAYSAFINDLGIGDYDKEALAEREAEFYSKIPQNVRKYIDRNKTYALRIISMNTNSVPTKYYFEAYKEAQAKGKEEFKKWYHDNHIYNPYSHKIEPLKCWTTLEYIDDPIFGDKITDIYQPAWHWLEKEIRHDDDTEYDSIGAEDILAGGTIKSKDFRNKNYKEMATTASNYKGGNPDFDSKVKRNKFEDEIKELLEQVIKDNSKTFKSKQFFRQGYAPIRAKNKELTKKDAIKEGGKLIGWINNATGREPFYNDDYVDYGNDSAITAPMTALLKSKDTVKIDKKRPTKDENESDSDYQQRLKTWEEDKRKAEANNMKIHKELLDKDWKSVFEDFIEKSAHFNAIQDNKYMLFYGKHMLDDINVYVKNYGFGDLQKTGKKTLDGEEEYVTKKDTRLQEQYTNWIRRLVFDQWKKPNNKLTRAANVMQSLTSAKFMMLNLNGGIANVTAGSTQILGEVIANEYFGNKTWHKGLNTWRQGIPAYLADMNSDKSDNLQAAIVKFMNVVDFEDLNYAVKNTGLSEKVKKLRDAMYSPQSMGEHMMQNGAMFAIMHSHRLVKRMNLNTGKYEYVAMNEAEYMRDANERALQNIMTDKERKLFEEFKKNELSDANTKKEYTWFRKDLTTEFVNIYFNDENKEKFINKRREYQKKAKEEFNNDETHPTIYNQLTVKDGYMDFKDDSIFAQIGKEDAYKILSELKGRIISVNKKIHGVYDRLGGAKLESEWWGGLAMQYHKHLWPGIMKRYRRQGYFNEERGTIEKGCYASLKDFLALPLHKRKFANKLQEDNNMSDANIQATQGIQNLLKSYVDFALNIRTNWNILPEYERANCRRALGDLLGCLSAVCLGIAAQCLIGDDDDDNLLYNMFIYQADRLASESAMYFPLGAIAEGEKLWSSPIAAKNSITDGLETAGLISRYILQGDDFDAYYSTGLYNGENKIWVQIRRNIPIYHSIDMVNRLSKSNKYYKLTDNMLSIIPTRDIANAIKGK